MAIKLGQRW